MSTTAKSRIGRCLLACLFMSGIGLMASPPTEAGWGDTMKKKLAEKARKAGEQVDKAVDAGTDQENGAAPGAQSGSEEGASSEADGTGGKVSVISTKFDYVPGDSVMFMDDFKQDEMGEFPARWTLKMGTYEVAEREGQRWLRCVSPDGTIRMKLPAASALPEFWTLDFDFFGTEPMGSGVIVRGLGGTEQNAWEAWFFNGSSVTFRSGEIFSSTPIEGTVPGHHHLMLMARGNALKVYVDRQRVVNVPEVSTEAGMPSVLEFRMLSSSKPMIANVRFAEGCRPARDMLAAGKFVTHGIRFATGSDVVLPESAPILRQVAAYLEANAAVKLVITGHTDNVGSAASNLDLSMRRAASVARLLVAEFKIAEARLQAEGRGDTRAMASNASPEGRAMNRRVEFAKL